MKNTKQIIEVAWKNGFVVPAFNIPYLPMVKPVIEAVRDENSFALVQVARLEWKKFGSGSMEAVRDEFRRWEDGRHVRLHLDHVPVIDEDNLRVDYIDVVKEAVALGYDSLMVDGSRLPFAENVAATKAVCEIAHGAGKPCEAELGAVLGHEAGPLPPYDEIFESGKGFTVADEAAEFVRESGCDWLSVAIGNIHGAISEAARGQEKPKARLNIEHLKKLKDATGIPLVLHGGSGIQKAYIMEAIKSGIAKINIGMEIRQPFRECMDSGDVEAGIDKVYHKTRQILREALEISGTADTVAADR